MKPAEPNSAKVVPLRRGRDDLEFLPAALEIVETPASPLPRAVAASLAGFLVIAVGWACIGHIDIIATAQGKVVPTGRVKVIQPLESGIVSAIHVNDGDRVTEGQVLIEMDQTTSRADRDRAQYDLMRARLDAARLSALRAGLNNGYAPVDFTPPPGAPAYEVARTEATMAAQAEQQVAKIAALDQQIAQKDAEADSISAAIDKLEAGLPYLADTADIRKKAMQIEYGNRIAHLDAQFRLSDQNHELITQRRHAVEIQAARKALEASREQTRAEYARGIVTDLAEAEQKAAQTAQDLIKAEKKMQDQILHAPMDGTVQQLAIHTVGGVATPAQALMVVVPADANIEVEAMVLNNDIGFVHDGDPVEIKVDTFNFTKYGLLHGKVVSVSRDAIARDKATAQADAQRQSGQTARSSEPPGQELLYSARVALDETRMQVEDRMVDLAPGMAVTAEIKTGQRRIIEYLLSPLLRYKQESLRER
ncbi:HlyD family type I secretion periplasmic adaptor subunit [Bradyrhizobium genosp. A]|uniref:HlyD family type I secretion periplasmic adaptor subunit n=1 Tax=Bradyrhizobium genosp. A TaxID=83626 RepID=UPI003CEB5C25